MRLWRAKKMSKEAGRLAQICVWTPERVADLTRELCTRVAEATPRGEDLRVRLLRQLERRRTLGYEWHGFSTHVEMDHPYVGRWWAMKNIGGRILGPSRTHVELSPDEAAELDERLRRLCQREIEAWLEEHDLLDRVRDNTGVAIGDSATKDPNRPADDTAFAINEARIAKSALEESYRSRKPPVDDPSVIEYEGFHGFPSFCQVVHRKKGDRVQFALIHMKNGGTSPTNMVESLATHMRQRFYPKLDAGQMDWFDVVPPHLYRFVPLSINSVVMQHANGVYDDPEWHVAQEDPEWFALIQETAARLQALESKKLAASPKRRTQPV